MSLLWLLLRVRWRRALAPSLVVALLIGVIGGFALAAASSARRVESAYRTLLTEIDAPDLVVGPKCVLVIDENFCLDEFNPDDSEGVEERLLTIDVVAQARLFYELMPYFVDADGASLLAEPDNPTGCFERDRSVHLVAPVAGTPREQPLPFRLEGSLPRVASKGVVLATATAERVGLAIGDSVRLAGWCTEDGDPVGLATAIDLEVTGLSVGPLDVEPPGTGLSFEPAYIDSAVFDALVAAGAQPETNVLVWLDPNASPTRVAAGLIEFDINLDLRERAAALDEALATDARLLWLLAGVGVLAGVLVLAPVLGRNLRDTGPDIATLAALGVQRPQIAQQGVVHCAALAVVGAMTAAILAAPLQMWMPNGLAAAIESDRPIAIDWLVTVTGVGLILVAVVAIGLLLAWKIGVAHAPDATDRLGSGSRVVQTVRLRPATRTGVLAALGTPVGPRRASPWPSLISMMLVATAGVASMTYVAGLNHLADTPSVLGWSWDGLVRFEFEPDEPVDLPAVLTRINEIDGIEQATSGTAYPPWFLFATAPDVGFVYPWTFASGHDAIGPVIWRGRAPEGPDEIAIDPVFADLADLEIGDTVVLAREALQSMIANELMVQAQESGYDGLIPSDYDQEPLTAVFEITGIAILPLERQEPVAQATFTLQGYSAFVEPTAAEIAAARDWLPDDLPSELRSGIEEVFGRLGVDDRADAVYFRLSGDSQATIDELAKLDSVAEVIAPTPPQILTTIGVNVDRSGHIPTALANTVAVAFAMLAGYLLFASVRARRFEIAVMRAMGMSTSGIRRSVAAQATATAVVVLLVAIPVGVVIGRWAWLAFARDLDVLPVSITPWRTLAIASVVAVAMVNIAALTLGWSTTKRSPGRDLRAE